MDSRPVALPLVCMYLFLEEGGETVPPHPSPRTRSAVRYLECALVQAASLRLWGAECDLAIVANGPALEVRGGAARAIWARLEELGVRRLESDLRIGQGGAAASRFPWEAIHTVAAAEPAERTVWIPNLDCVWVDPARALDAEPGPDQVGCLPIGYPPDWSVGGSAAIGRSRIELGRLAVRLGASPSRQAPPWIGADLLVGEIGAVLALVESCDQLEARLPAEGGPAGNEQLLTLAGALGQVRLADLSAVAARIQTGARHGSAMPGGVESLGLWHLPAEKGLSLRRAARAILGGGGEALRADLAEPRRAMKRFNLGAPRRTHQLRDDAWVLAQRLRGR
jgi:hypothetical protein